MRFTNAALAGSEGGIEGTMRRGGDGGITAERFALDLVRTQVCEWVCVRACFPFSAASHVSWLHVFPRVYNGFDLE